MELLYLLAMFAAIVLVIWLKQPLYLAMLAGILTGALLFRVPVSAFGGILLRGVTGRDTLMMLLAFYTITYLQRMLESRGRLIQAERALAALTGSRRANAMLTPFVVGMLPSVGAVLIAAPIVDRIAGEELDREERTFVSSFYRHISEAFLPTYSNILLALQLSGQSPLRFVLLMLPMVALLFALGYWLYVRKLGKTGEAAARGAERRKAFRELVASLWTVLLVVVLIMFIRAPVFLVVVGVIALNAVLERFPPRQLLGFAAKAFETRLMVNTVLIMVFKEVLLHTGALGSLPNAFSALPVPVEWSYSLVMLLGTVIAGTQAMVAILIPIAFAGAQAGMPLLILLMCMGYIAAQVSPTHICLSVVTERYGTTLASLVRKTLPVMLAFLLACAGYFYMLKLIF